MKKLFILILFLSVSGFVFIGDKISSKYGRGVYHKYTDIKFGTSITKINDVFITTDKDWRYEGYIFSNGNYITLEQDTFFVKSIVGYCSKSGLSVFIMNNENKLIKLHFHNRESIYRNNPKVDYLNNINCSKFINIKNPPFLIKYWGGFYYLACLISLILLVLLVYILASAYYTSSRNKKRKIK